MTGDTNREKHTNSHHEQEGGDQSNVSDRPRFSLLHLGEHVASPNP